MKKLLCAFFNYRKLYRELHQAKQLLQEQQKEIEALSRLTDSRLQYSFYQYERKLKNPSEKWPSVLISDYYRMLDTERYPVYAPLVKYLERIGSVGGPTEIWSLPNGARVSIRPNINKNFPFMLKLLPSLGNYKHLDGWSTTGWWSKQHGAGNINQVQVGEVVSVLQKYLQVQRGVR